MRIYISTANADVGITVEEPETLKSVQWDHYAHADDRREYTG